MARPPARLEGADPARKTVCHLDLGAEGRHVHDVLRERDPGVATLRPEQRRGCARVRLGGDGVVGRK